MSGRAGGWAHVVGGAALFAASFGGSVLAPGLAAAGTSPTSASAAWGAQMDALAVPASGCFSASYPTVEWRPVPCQNGPGRPFAPHRAGPVRRVVGTGVNYSAEVASGSISTATGSFPYVSPGSTEKGFTTTPNTYSLQLNTEFFPGSPACDGALVPSKCLAWQQFLYATTNRDLVFMQYWLITYSTKCPAGWYRYLTTCYRTSAAAVVPATSAPTIATLESVSLTGTVHASGNDSVAMSYGGTHATAVGADSLVGLAGNWTIAEFGIFGAGTGSEAMFSPGTTIDVKTSVDSGARTAPTCDYTGFTGETNNLSFADAPTLAAGTEPAIETQQTSTGGSPGCAAAGMLTVPGKPGKPKATAGNAKAQISWTAPTTGGAPITRYVVTSSPTAAVCTWTSGPLRCTLTGLKNGTPYTFTVRAHNSAGTSKSSAASAAVVPAPTRPGKPKAPTVKAGDASATAKWTEPTTGGSPVTAYVVTSTTQGHSCAWTTGVLTCTVTGLINTHPYRFTVLARNAVGTSPASADSKVVTPKA